jgi:uncharacterized protein
MDIRQITWTNAENLAFGWVKDDVTGHDRFHLERVRRVALALAQSVGADPVIVAWAALFHDALDSKSIQAGQERDARVKQMEALMADAGLTTQQKASIWNIIRGQSFSHSLPAQPGLGNHHLPADPAPEGQKSNRGSEPPSLEFQVVQDADRLDALGAIGIARCLAYGANKGQPIHHPEWQPRQHLTQAEYRNGKQSSINHFYEKLLLLKDRMNTPLAKAMAEKRHARMESFLRDFNQEWSGEA